MSIPSWNNSFSIPFSLIHFASLKEVPKNPLMTCMLTNALLSLSILSFYLHLESLHSFFNCLTDALRQVLVTSDNRVGSIILLLEETSLGQASFDCPGWCINWFTEFNINIYKIYVMQMYSNSNDTKFNVWNSSALVYTIGGLEVGQ